MRPEGLSAAAATKLKETVAVVALIAAACRTAPASTATGSPSAAHPSRGPAATPAPPQRVHTRMVARLPQPLGMAVRAGDDALYVSSKKGTLWALRGNTVDPRPALDLSHEVSRGPEQGLLGVAFSPDGRFVYVDYTDRRGDTNVVEYGWRAGRADTSTRRRVLFVDQPFPNHNGGNLVFGPDGYLYIGLGDGGSDYRSGDPQGDPHRNGQNLGVLLGKILRIQPRLPDETIPRRAAYAIPVDNPFAGRPGARGEIWAYGLRNPWRFSFDRETSDLWIGDVGAGAREEIDVQPAGSEGGENYGWNALEGTVAWRTAPQNAVPPVYEYDHRGGGCSVTGGYVYRGRTIPGLRGWYIFGDYCLGTLNGLRLDAGGLRVYLISGQGVQGISSFGEDQQGELYALSIEGAVYRLEP